MLKFFFFFWLRGSSDWAIGRNAREFRPNKYDTRGGVPYEYISVFTHAHMQGHLLSTHLPPSGRSALSPPVSGCAAAPADGRSAFTQPSGSAGSCDGLYGTWALSAGAITNAQAWHLINSTHCSSWSGGWSPRPGAGRFLVLTGGWAAALWSHPGSSTPQPPDLPRPDL